MRISNVVRSQAWLKATYLTSFDKLLSYSDGPLQDVKHTWDAGGNLRNRYNLLNSDNETFGYDFLDRLTSVSGNYSASYSYNSIGNIDSMNGNSYTYNTNGIRPHAVTAVAGSGNYTYDANGNMLTRGSSQNITWDAENRPISITTANGTTTFVYDGDGNRVKKTEGGETVLYVNKYYEKNLTTGNETRYYYLGGRLVAKRTGTTLNYIHQDHLTGTSVMSDSSGALISSISYSPFGLTRSGSVPTDIKFTGQRLDDTGLYYYGARYYDPAIGRFISPDSIVQSLGNPQSLNRYSYVFNNPLKYTDPTGLIVEFENEDEILAMLQALADAGMDYAPGSDVDKMVQDWAELRLAWDELASVAPELTGYLEREDVPLTVIKWDADWFEKNGPGAAGATLPGEGTILLNPTVLHRMDARETVMTLGHEGFHKAVELIYGNGGTLQEEAIAFGLGFSIGKQLGYTNPRRLGEGLVPEENYRRFEGRVGKVAGDLLMAIPAYRGASQADVADRLSLSSYYGLARWFWPGIR